jgi:hypothetical protein
MTTTTREPISERTEVVHGQSVTVRRYAYKAPAAPQRPAAHPWREPRSRAAAEAFSFVLDDLPDSIPAHLPTDGHKRGGGGGSGAPAAPAPEGRT